MPEFGDELRRWTPEMEADLQKLKLAEREAELSEFFDGLDEDFREECMAICLSESEEHALYLSEQGRPSATDIVKRIASVAPRGEGLYEAQSYELDGDRLD